MSDQEQKAKDILRNLPVRKEMGHKIIDRVGGRAWQRPSYIAVSRRLYEIYDIPDPWDPNSKNRKWDSRLGPVSLRLGENRRQPAPHLRPKEPKKDKPAAKKFQPKGIPRAKQATKQAAKAPAPPPIPKQSKSGKLASEFGNRAGPQALKKLPIRPDIDFGGSPESSQAPAKASQASFTARSRHRATVPQSGATKATNKALSPEEIESRRPVMPKNTNTSLQGGRVSMRRTVARAPVVREIPKPSTPQPEASPPASPSAPPPSRTARPSSPNSMGLDDLFGSGGEDEGRMRLGRRKKKKPDS